MRSIIQPKLASGLPPCPWASDLPTTSTSAAAAAVAAAVAEEDFTGFH